MYGGMEYEPTPEPKPNLYPAGRYENPYRCYVCGEMPHKEWCRIYSKPCIREAWDLVAGRPCGLDKQFLAEMHISWQVS